jgi:regulator of sigma E protease
MIPIGGFVRIAGEEVDDDKKVSKDRKIYSKPIWQRFVIMFFGAFNNFILAILVLFLIGIIYGSTDMSSKIPGVIEDSPMALSGLKKGDKIVKIDGERVSSIDDVQLFLALADTEKGAKITVERDSKKYDYVVVPLKGKEREEKGYSYGIKFNTKVNHGFIDSVKYSFLKTRAIFRQMVFTLKSLFTGGISVKSLSGPVGIYQVVGEASSSSFASVLLLIALLSINVGFINLLPFPAFDGGRILFLFIEKIKGSPIRRETENMIHNIGFLLLMAFMIYITFNDILRLI